jgi:hypothetical protein
MTPEIFAEWFRLQGHRVVRTESSYWVNQGLGAYQAFPYHWVIDPSEEEIRDFLWHARAIALRYSTSLNSPEGRISYHAILENSNYELETLPSNARHNVRRGLSRCTVERISLKVLAVEGWAVQQDTLRRQKRNANESQKWWRRMIEAADGLQGFEAWAAFVGTAMAASVLTFRMDDTVYMLYQQCLKEYLRNYVNNALAFVVTQNMLRKEGVNRILYGLHSLDAPASIDEFKFRMGYEAKPVRQRVAFHPLVTPLIGGVSQEFLKGLRKVWTDNSSLAKAEGMVRFYNEGMKDWRHQAVPEVLLNALLSRSSVAANQGTD